jgi:hypothetical protein
MYRVPNYVPYIECNKMAEALVDSLYRNKEKCSIALCFDFRIHISKYFEDREELEYPFFFSVIYYAPSNYVKVFYRRNLKSPFVYPEDGPFERIADHDSCWRDCWSDIYKEYSLGLENFVTKNDLNKEYLSYYSSIERLYEIQIGEWHYGGTNSFPIITQFKRLENNKYDIYFYDSEKEYKKNNKGVKS